MTDALQQRSRYQCALKRSEECISCSVGEFFLFIVINTYVSYVIVAGSLQKAHSNKKHR